MIAKKYRKGIEMIRTLGETAIYGGKEYEFLTRSDGTCAIYSNQKKDVDNGFLHGIGVGGKEQEEYWHLANG